jgi:hypothetical protein
VFFYMASTSTEPLAELHQEIEALFSWNPPQLDPAPLPSDKKPSTSTRPPAFYDKHFSDNLVLRQVIRLPTLIEDLAKNVDVAYHAASETLPPLKGFITAELLDIDLGNLDAVVTDEEGVADMYHQTTARYCSPLASTLA